MSDLRVRFKLTDRALELREKGVDVAPRAATPGAACFDLCAVTTAFVAHGRPTLVALGVILEIPAGYEGIVRGRSGLAKEGHLVIWGTVDADFRGELLACCTLTPGGAGGWAIAPGDRIAQLAIRPIPDVLMIEEDGELTKTARGAGGWGSTGK